MRESSAEKELFRFNSDELSRKELEKFGRSHWLVENYTYRCRFALGVIPEITIITL